MLRGIVWVASLAVLPAFAGKVQLLPVLPSGAVSHAMQIDAAGNIYIAGSVVSQGQTDAFVARLPPDASKLTYFTRIAGTQFESASGLALGSDGSVYVTGDTESRDFPVTEGALERVYAGIGQNQAFLAKLNPAGSVVYATYITGEGTTHITGIALDDTGAVFLTGIGGPGYKLSSLEPYQGFVMKLDAGLSRVLLSLYGYGGGLIRLDGQGNIYLAGSAQANVTSGAIQILTLPALPAGGFQPTHDARFCLTLGSGPGGFGGQFSCRYQYVAKLNAAGTPFWATYVTGTYGASVRGMAVDRTGNVILAGTTNSDDYPVTPGAFQGAYAAAAVPFPGVEGSTYQDPPPGTGYVTKINASGTALIWSTYFGGSHADEITGLAVAASGDLYVSGRAGSSDLPALAGTPDGCRPSAVQELGFVVRVAADGATVGPVQLIAGAPDCSYFSCSLLSDYTSDRPGWPLVLRADGTALVAGTNGTLAAVDFQAGSRLACMVDPADNVQVTTVAPGQLLTLFGADLAPAAPFSPDGGTVSTSNFGVFFNGIAAPILYSAGQQINVQVPFEIAGQTSVQMQVVDRQVPLTLAETRTLGVVDRQPAVFLSPAAWGSDFPAYSKCGDLLALGAAAVVLNADGTLNDCTNPAVTGSTVTVFVDGLGVTSPALATGAIAQRPSVALTPAVEILDPNLAPVASTTTESVPGSISGVARVRFQVPPTPGPAGSVALTPRIAGKNLRERLILVWTRPK